MTNCEFLICLCMATSIFGQELMNNSTLKINRSIDSTSKAPVHVKQVSEDPFVEHNQNPQSSAVNTNETEGDRNVDENDLDNWEAPYDIRKEFVYYHSGFDLDDRPIWIGEVGKWNFRKITDGGQEAEKIFEKYCDQIVHRILNSLKERSTADNPVTQEVIIADMDGFDLIKVSHLPIVRLILRLMTKFRHLIDEYVYVGIVVNNNAAAHQIVHILRPILTNIFERLEFYGTNSARWIPHVRKHCPRDQIPSWYGGVPDFKPLKVYG